MEITALAPRHWAQADRLIQTAIAAGASHYYSNAEASAWYHTHKLQALLCAEHIVAAAKGEEILGIAGADSKHGYPIRFVFVAPNHWRKRVGSALVGSLEAFCITRKLPEIRVAAALNAIDFYSSLGYSTDNNLRLCLGAESGDSDITIRAVTMSKAARAISSTNY